MNTDDVRHIDIQEVRAQKQMLSVLAISFQCRKKEIGIPIRLNNKQTR